MELSNKQSEILESPPGCNLLIEGYTGVGKTTLLLKKYDDIIKTQYISRNNVIFIVSDEIKKQITLNQYFLIASNYNLLNIYTLNELIQKYLTIIELPLFSNTIGKNKKKAIIEEILAQNTFEHNFPIDFIVDEINFIQSNICIKDDDELKNTLKKELKTYIMLPRKSNKMGLLSFKEKQEIWNIYEQYLAIALNEDFFDEQTLYQSFLRLLYHQHQSKELALNFSYIFIDDSQDFTKVQLDIIYYLFNRNLKNSAYYIAVDEIKAKDRYRYFKESILFKEINKKIVLEENYRNSNNVFNIINDYLHNNELINIELPYKSNNDNTNYKSVLTYFYNKKSDEKQNVFFDRLNYLTSILKYSYRDILVVFTDMNNLNDMKSECLRLNINVVNLYEHIENMNLDALTFLHKDDLVSCEFNIVILYDADDKKLCTGPINKIINVNNNYLDSLYFYITLGNATDFLIINSSFSEPSHLLLPAKINVNNYVFEINSQFEIKSTLNIYRISDFIAYIKENLTRYYGYENKDLKPHPVFDILIDNNEKIGIKILDYNITDEVINYILNNNEDVQYVVVFDSHHYLTFKKIENKFIRVADIPKKS